MHTIFAAFGVLLALAGLPTVSPAAGQGAQKPPPLPTSTLPPEVKPSKVERLGPNLFRIGRMRVDTSKRELSVSGTINDVTILEFVASTLGGHKAYESAITVDTDAISFNTALLLLGMDAKRSVVPTRHFDPAPPDGDPVDIFVDAVVRTPSAAPSTRRLRVEELLFDQRTGKTLPEGPWVYTGSSFIDDPSGRRYMAEIDGVLIGFVHSPSPVIENPRAGAVDGFGSIVLNPNLGLSAGSPITLTIKALPRTKPDRR